MDEKSLLLEVIKQLPFGKRIRAKREELKLSQVQLSKIFKISQSSMSKIEKHPEDYIISEKIEKLLDKKIETKIQNNGNGIYPFNKQKRT